jgi:hypothetical protein
VETSAKGPDWDSIRRWLPEISAELDALSQVLEEEKRR